MQYMPVAQHNMLHDAAQHSTALQIAMQEYIYIMGMCFCHVSMKHDATMHGGAVLPCMSPCMLTAMTGWCPCKRETLRLNALELGSYMLISSYCSP